MTDPSMAEAIQAVAQRLSQTVGELSPFTGTRPAIFVRRAPDTPNQLYRVSGYWQRRDLILPDRLFRIQVMSRGMPGDRLGADEMADAAMQVLAGQHHQEWAGLTIDRCTWESAAELSPDVHDREIRTDNYEITTHRK